MNSQGTENKAGLSREDNITAWHLYSIDRRRIVKRLSRPDYVDDMGPPPLLWRPRSEEDKNRDLKIEYGKNMAKAAGHYATHANKYHEQAIQDAKAAGVEVNFQGDVATNVKFIIPDHEVLAKYQAGQLIPIPEGMDPAQATEVLEQFHADWQASQ